MNETHSPIQNKKIPQNRLSDIQTIFHLFDKDKDGNISGSDLFEIFKSIGLDIPPQQIDVLLNEIRGRASTGMQQDPSLSSSIDCAMFSGFITRQLDSAPLAEQLKETFSLLDTSGDGYITPESLAEVCSKLGVSLTDQDARQLMVQSDGQAKADYNKFVKLMQLSKG
ncbi:calmodulin-like protein [Cryptosporidium canis]|uniref:Calmodulin n=1 Tax=Cryptosporidium canis TaxID=195482 RepID=A0ABQ8P7B2_9CRYT|nr:calmodulin-like protein [Cryptosporidium canis]KAJ1614053.1 calmodulin-like protein [Cryptosporidium canis]